MHSTPRNEHETTKKATLDPGGVKGHSAILRGTKPRGSLDPPWVTGGLPPWFRPFLVCMTNRPISEPKRPPQTRVVQGSSRPSLSRETEHYLAPMYEEKSRGSGRGSHKTQIEGYGWVTRMGAAAAVREKNESARLLRARHSARSGSLDS
ncbi:hypothetical protein CRG98_012407 [Punica granatum]|uniref:Uncharacterized protein n=1 Tax=Punica granatum TaxID=22663 RepID=A0A2I0KFW4_PUNGR|nr:hypothetical protein CRG98_012407 [Punica granatum]